MAKKLVNCKHCEGKKNCARSGGRSCPDCLRAAGRKPRDWGIVRCANCGGKGKIWIDVPDEAPAAEAPAPAEAPAAEAEGE
jgi:hypothetical protein